MWSPEQVGFWLADVLGFPEHSKVFVAMNVCGSSLSSLDDDTLQKKFLVADSSQRETILSGIQALPQGKSQEKSIEFAGCDSHDTSQAQTDIGDDSSFTSLTQSDSRLDLGSPSDDEFLSIEPSMPTLLKVKGSATDCKQQTQALQAESPQKASPRVSLAAVARQAVLPQPGQQISEMAGPLVIYRCEGAVERRASARRNVATCETEAKLSRSQSEAAFRIGGKLERLAGMARDATPQRTRRDATPQRSLTPRRSLTPQSRSAVALPTCLAPFPAATVGKASRGPQKPWCAQFDRDPGLSHASSPRWSPAAEGDAAPGVAPFSKACRGPLKTWESRFERNPGVKTCPTPRWSPVCEKQGHAPGVSAFSSAPRLPGGVMPAWLRTTDSFT